MFKIMAFKIMLILMLITLDKNYLLITVMLKYPLVKNRSQCTSGVAFMRIQSHGEGVGDSPIAKCISVGFSNETNAKQVPRFIGPGGFSKELLKFVDPSARNSSLL